VTGTGTSAARHRTDPDGRGRAVGLVAGGTLLVAALAVGGWLLLGRGSGDGGKAGPGAAATGSSATSAAAVRPSGASSGAAAGASTPGGTSTVRPRSTDPVRDGDLEFTVTGVRTAVGTLGRGDLVRRSTGQFVLVTVSVRNRGRAAVRFDFGNQLLVDVKGREFDADDEAGVYLEEARAFLAPVGAGRTVSGVLVFDLPKGDVLASVDLHGQGSPDGVSIPLT
jgi:hypothetical protein